MFSAVIITAGRTGSQLICSNLVDYFNVEYHNDFNTYFKSGIVHTHNPMYMPPNNNFYCIISRRRNKFNAILSGLITKYTGEISNYSSKKINRIKIDVQSFTDAYLHYNVTYKLIEDRIYKHYNIIYRIIDNSIFKETIEVYYEDLIEDPMHLFSLFNIDHKIEPFTLQSPYNYYELIENVDELNILYYQFEEQPLTVEQINRVLKNLTNK